MNKALILGTNATQADIIYYLKEIGWEVHSCGNKNEGLGSKIAHHFHQVDTIDIKAVTDLSKDISADIVYSVSSDINIRSATRVSETLGLPLLLDSKTIDLFHFKDQLRAFLNQNKINSVEYKYVKSINDASDWSIFPCVIKPVDSQGQRGIELLKDKTRLNKAVEIALKNSSTKSAILEEFLEGVEVSTNMIIQDRNIIVNEFTERLVHGHHYFGLPRGHSIPVRKVSNKEIKEASNIVVQLVEKLQMRNAVLYIQIIITEKGPKIVEVAPRLDGCHIWRLLKLARGYDLRKLAIDCLIGNKIIYNSSNNFNNEPYTLEFHQLKTGTVFHEFQLEKINNLVFNEYRYKDGDTVQPINGYFEVVGYYIKKG